MKNIIAITTGVYWYKSTIWLYLQLTFGQISNIINNIFHLLCSTFANDLIVSTGDLRSDIQKCSLHSLTSGWALCGPRVRLGVVLLPVPGCWSWFGLGCCSYFGLIETFGNCFRFHEKNTRDKTTFTKKPSNYCCHELYFLLLFQNRKCASWSLRKIGKFAAKLEKKRKVCKLQVMKIRKKTRKLQLLMVSLVWNVESSRYFCVAAGWLSALRH